jgi:hypothetical protein
MKTFSPGATVILIQSLSAAAAPKYPVRSRNRYARNPRAGGCRRRTLAHPRVEPDVMMVAAG